MIRILLLAAAVATLSSCSKDPVFGLGVDAYNHYTRPAMLPADPSAVHVKVSTSRQRVYVMEGDKALLVMPVSVGAPDTPTPHGSFTITSKSRRKRATSHGWAWSGDKTDRCYREDVPAGWSFKGTPLPYWCGFGSRYGFHSGWIKHRPTTYDGCIRMHHNVAPQFYQLVRVGTPVTIADWLPEDRLWGNIPLPPDAGPLPDHPPSYYIGDAAFTFHKEPLFESSAEQ